MRPRSRWLQALLVSIAVSGALGAVAGAPAWAAGAGKVTPSKQVAKQLKAAQEAIKAHRYDDAFAKLKEASAFNKKTPLDQHLINDLYARAYFGTRDYAQATKYFDAEINDGLLSAAQQLQLIKVLATLNYSTRSYDKAIEYGTRALKANSGDAAMRTLVGQSYYQKGDWKGLRRFEEELVNAQLKRGEVPKAEALQMLQTACARLGDNECETRSFETLVQYYPKPEYWENLFYDLNKSAAQNDRIHLQLYRLMLEVNVLKRPDWFNELAHLALEQGAPGEAQSVLQKGFDSKVFSDPHDQDKNRRFLAAVKQAVATDEPKLAQRERQADAAPNGEAAVSVGYDYLGYGQNDKAVAEISKGLAKGGLKDEAGARLLLGIAQLRAGHRDDAIKSFHAVKGDPTLERIAALWALHAKQPVAVARR